MRALFWIGVAFGIGISSPALALDCIPMPFEERVQHAKTVVVAEMVRYHSAAQGKASQNEMKVLKLLKNDHGPIKAEQTTFLFPERQGWDAFRYKPGQVVMFFFVDGFHINCNHPIVLK